MKNYLIIVLVMVAACVRAAQPTVGGRTVVLETNGTLTNSTQVGGTVTAVTNLDLTVSRALVSNPAGVPTNSVTTAAELAFVNGVTSAIQTQLNAKQASFTTGLGVTNNGGTLSNNIVAGSQITITGGANGQLSIASTGAGTNAQTCVIGITIDGGGSAITTGVKGYILVPYACTINSVTLLADQSGSSVVDIWKCTYTQFDAGSTHPVAGDKITASAPPTISSATKAQDTTLTGWTTSISANDVLAFNVNSDTTITRVTLVLKVTK